MIYHLVQPWGRDKYRQAGRISSHPTVEEAYAEMDRYAARLAEDDLPADTLELYVVDENREPVPRPVKRPHADAVPCERCGAEMFRMHAVWRCPACRYKTDCCGW